MGIERAMVSRSGGTGKRERKGVGELGTLDGPSVRLVLRRLDAAVGDGGTDGGFGHAGRARRFLKRQDNALASGGRVASGAGTFFQMRLQACFQDSAARTWRETRKRSVSGSWASAQTRMSSAVSARAPRSFS